MGGELGSTGIEARLRQARESILTLSKVYVINSTDETVEYKMAA